ncbi:hypothetical protein NLJ89_g9257 [Agrocybe chaxingu]|uniref:Phosphatidic acid phosphatase type 2/haloperoxidase domain-containing protein n=1 Tax=Agrocybe chaxingu TaxID=84603 RepID=A0A9W8JT29_9AGAR|nr:hypothetical protein NLJ89_g9257 [Agrocybe chaxingu]
MQNADGSKSVHFTLSIPPSEASSRASSPAPSPISPTFHYYDDASYDYIDAKVRESLMSEDSTPGRQGRDVYEATLPWWRAAIRRKLVATVYEESKILATMQSKIRHPWLDAYFVYTSSLGTHTFFMILLPAFFFFGYDEIGRGLLIVLALGVYFASVVKDLICSPRPFAPPVTRLTIGTHHLEYGFPSTHSTNSVSIALFFFAIVHRLASTPIASTNPASVLTSRNSSSIEALLPTISATETVISPSLYVALCVILIIYTFSIVFGRLYTAMHSFTDCLMGVVLGAGIWWGHTSWAGFPFLITSSNILYSPLNYLGLGTTASPNALIIHLGTGLGGGQWVESWMHWGGWEVPLILIPLCLLAVHKHPQPVDDCPCFEDAIAFMSVVLGAQVSRWVVSFSGIGAGMREVVVTPGSGWVQEMGQWVQVQRGWDDVVVWWSFATLKMFVF